MEANDKIGQSRQVIATLVIVGPIGLLLATILFLRRVNLSVAALVAAARQLGRGNLDFRINQPLKNEFLEVATAFNSMAIAISDEKKNSAAVQRLYQALFESAKDAILIMSTEPTNPGKVISANKAAIDLFGYTFEELKDMCCGELCAENADNSCRERINRILGGEWVERISERRRKDGSIFKAEVSAGPMVIDNVNYMLTFTRDITEREQAKQELLRANQMSVVGQMAVGLAHEIKNPLAGIKATIEVLISDLNLEDDDRELMLRLISEIDRMERLLKNLLRYARPPQPHPEVTNINRLLEYTLRNVEVTSATTTTDKIHFTKEFSTQPLQIEIDPEQLQQVLLNLYLNAVEAIKGPGRITTRSRLSQDGSRILIDISDTGAGMSEAVRKNLFKPFFTTKSKGTGLGLAICLRLIEQHKGSILVNSQPGKGSTFTIVLPTHPKD
nr:ATP-binding protein [Pelovirga terrestris]